MSSLPPEIAVVNERVKAVERELSTLTNNSELGKVKIDDIDRRVIRLEGKHDSLHEKIDNINKVLWWILQTVFGAVIVAAVAFITAGGLNLTD